MPDSDCDVLVAEVARLRDDVNRMRNKATLALEFLVLVESKYRQQSDFCCREGNTDLASVYNLVALWISSCIDRVHAI